MKVLIILYLLFNVVLMPHSGIMARELNMPKEAKAGNGDQFGQSVIGAGKSVTDPTRTRPYPCPFKTPYSKCLPTVPSGHRPCSVYRFKRTCPPPATK